jgi:ATP-dependent Clp protease, protease subunit
MRNRLFNLFSKNRAVSAKSKHAIKMLDADEAEVTVYDYIVAADADAEWFGGVSAETFAREVRALKAKTIHVRINSPGGDVFGGRVMQGALAEHSANVVVHIDGLAASAASVVAMGGDKIIMGDGAMMMIHRAWTLAIGNANDMTEAAALLNKIDETLARTYATRAKGDALEMLSLMNAETWFTASEAKAAGLADEVSNEMPVVEDMSRAGVWDLSAYARFQPAGAKQLAATSTSIDSRSDPEQVIQIVERAAAANAHNQYVASIRARLQGVQAASIPAAR